jgi:predicted DNA-binding transcriptional regulator YafY
VAPTTAQRSALGLRTVRRSVAALREAGVAIDTDVGRGGGIRLGTRGALSSVRLSHREAVGVLFALAVAESPGLPWLGSARAGLRTRRSSTFAPPERAEVQRRRQRLLVGRPASEAVGGSRLIFVTRGP